MHVLVVEDDDKMAELVTHGLQDEGWTVARSADGRSGLARALAEDYAVLVVDVMLPGLDGFGLVAALRQAGRQVPVLMLSARDGVADRVQGLQEGADDYLVKPFAFSELVARVRALARRGGSGQEAAVLTVGDLRLDLSRRRVQRAGQAIDLQPLELALLEYLMRHAGRVVSKAMIMEHVWNYNFDPQTNVVEARVCRLREKIDRPFKGGMIRTIRGVGYVLDVPR
jgi:two-component system, OmpR family, response regulator